MRYLIVKAFVGVAFLGSLTFAGCTAPAVSTQSNITTAATPVATQSNSSTAKFNHTSSETNVKTILPAELKWNNVPNLTGVQNAVGVGDAAKPELYAMFGKMEKGAQFPAHSHPDARITTVFSGTMYYGVGDKFDEASIKPYPAGSIVYTPAGAAHFMWAKDGETVMQETGFGPTGLSMTAKTQ